MRNPVKKKVVHSSYSDVMDFVTGKESAEHIADILRYRREKALARALGLQHLASLFNSA